MEVLQVYKSWEYFPIKQVVWEVCRKLPARVTSFLQKCCWKVNLVFNRLQKPDEQLYYIASNV